MATTCRTTAVFALVALLMATQARAQNSRPNQQSSMRSQQQSRQQSSQQGMSFGDHLRSMRDSLFGSPNNQSNQNASNQNASNRNTSNRNSPNHGSSNRSSSNQYSENQPQRNQQGQRQTRDSQGSLLGGAPAESRPSTLFGAPGQRNTRSNAQSAPANNQRRSNGNPSQVTANDRSTARAAPMYDGPVPSMTSPRRNSSSSGRAAVNDFDEPHDASGAFVDDTDEWFDDEMAEAPRTASRDDSGWQSAGASGGHGQPRASSSRSSRVASPAAVEAVVNNPTASERRVASSRRTAQPGYRADNSDESAAPDLIAVEEDEPLSIDTTELREARRMTDRSNVTATANRPSEASTPKRDVASVRSSRRAQPETEVVEDAEVENEGPIRSIPAPRVASSARAALPNNDDEFVVTKSGPILQVATAGPRTVMVDKPATYKVTIENSADVPAEGLTVTVDVPDWAEVVSRRTTTGDAQESFNHRGAMQWNIPLLAALSREELTLEIVARENRSFDLAVQWNYKPVATQTQVQVREPKLEVAIDGPGEVSYAEKTVYKLTFSNPGTADAEKVVVRLLPLGPGEKAVDSHTIGRVAAGQSKVVEVELIARQEGDLQIKVEAQADGGLIATAKQDIRVLRAGLHLAVDAPKFRYAGAQVEYVVVVRNPGTESTRDVQINAQLPRGARFVSGSDGSMRGDTDNHVVWKVDHLKPGAERTLSVKCSLEEPGSNHFQVAATAAGELSHSAALTTRVEAVADLALQVNDPQGAVPAGEEVTYDLVVKNRGAKGAANVQVLAAFSDGVEPLGAASGEYEVDDGKVIFTPIARLDGGQERILRIKARATRGGNHLIRAEVHCVELEISLAAEETTRFYGDSAHEEAANSANSPTTPDEADGSESVEPEPLEALDAEPIEDEQPAPRYSKRASPTEATPEETAASESNAATAATSKPTKKVNEQAARPATRTRR
jgi:uncharacterized repeat protein (TIGR01451 family)